MAGVPDRRLDDRRFPRRTMLKGGLLVLSGGITGGLLAACGQSPSQAQPTATTADSTSSGTTPAAATQPASGSSSASPTASGSATGAGEPKPGGILQGAFELDPLSLDPHTNSNFSSLQGFEHCYESLTTYDEEMNVIPALAEQWEIAEDGLTYTFTLRPDVKFHNGKTMTGDDVKYSIERVLNPETASPWRSWLSAINEITVVEPLLVEMKLSEPYPDLLSSFAAMRASAIIPEGLAEEVNLQTTAVGTGPFKLVEYVPQDHITYERFDEYWGQPLPYLDGMVFKILSEENVRLAALQAGQIKYAAISAQGAEQLKNASNIQVLQSPYAWVDLTYVNVSRPPLNDARVRRAMRMAVNTNEMIQKGVFGAGVPSGPVPTGYGDWYLDPESLPYLEPDIEGAKALLAEAGYAGERLVINCSPQYPDFVANAVVMQQAFQAIGMNVEINQMEWGAQNAAYNAKDYDLSNSANTFRPGPDGYIYAYFHTDGNLNSGYSNPELDTLIEQARSTSDHDERVRLYTQIQQMLLEESPDFWWYVKYNIEAVANDLQGYVQSFTGRRMFLKQAWLNE